MRERAMSYVYDTCPVRASLAAVRSNLVRSCAGLAQGDSPVAVIHRFEGKPNSATRSAQAYGSAAALLQ